MGFFASLIAQIGANTTDFEKGVRKCELLAGGFAKNAAKQIAGIGAGYLTVNYAIGLMSESMQRAGQIKDLSDRLGMDVEMLQKFQYAAQQTGTDINAFAKSIQNINKTRAEALGDPNGEKANIFARYGIGLKELKSMSGEDIFLRIGDAVKAAANPQNELVTATDLLGKSAAQVFPAMRSGLTDLTTEASKLGQVLSKDVIEKLDNTSDRFDAIKNRVGNALARGVVNTFDDFDYATKWLGKFLDSGLIGKSTKETDAETGGSPVEQLVKKALKEATDKLNGKTAKSGSKDTVFDAATSKQESKSTPTEWAYKAPSGDKLREIGGFTGAAQNAQLAYLEKIRDATEKTAEATQKTATVLEDEGGSSL